MMKNVLIPRISTKYLPFLVVSSDHKPPLSCLQTRDHPEQHHNMVVDKGYLDLKCTIMMQKCPS